MRVSTFLAAVAALTISTSQAFAWGDMYTGDATADLSRQPLVQSYPAANYCPPGKQPVIVGGELCCGVPNAGPYYNPVASHAPKKKHTVTKTRYMPRAYAPVGEKGVVYK